MNKFLIPASLLLASAIAPYVAAQDDAVPAMMRIFDEAVFYDGYNSTVFDADLNDGIIRHANHLYAKRLTDEELNFMGQDLDMDVTVGALCDNYDRIGNINIAFVPKGQEGYDPNETMRIELGRFITPFFNKNKTPDEVPYHYNADAISLIFRDANLREKYDYYLEFELFGVPYAANEQVDGCAGRNDVFRGTLDFKSFSPEADPVSNHCLVPIVMKKPEYIGKNLNNYSFEGTDTIGKTTKTYTFEVPQQLEDARITLVMSNHGANSNGEEYNRRKHFVYVDGEIALVFTPGGKSCEPYRQYNTQGNGIYGWTEMSEAQWTSWNNWCPGDVIPTREIDLGSFGPGTHTVMIRVPKAKFAGKQGDFPVSMYLQGVTSGQLPAGIFGPVAERHELMLSLSGGLLDVKCDVQLHDIEIYNPAGTMLHATFHTDSPLDVSRLSKGTYIVVATTLSGDILSGKIVI